MRQSVTGWFLAATGILACPCHLVITLPLAVTLLTGTALGGWIATHQGAVVAGASLYFVGALVMGATLLLASKGTPACASGVECHPPVKRTGAPPGTVPGERADDSP